ncbi:MAG: UDP-N-acetylmuramoyl-L-alanine--D-glutamate ligase [Candidatus Cyclobacteriaceae bacterium M2_1C_046]
MSKKITILGAGESGTGAALLGKNKGYEVFVSDGKTIKTEYKNLLDEHEIPYEEGGHSDKINDADLVIKSPGIPYEAEVVNRFIAKGVQVIDEIEFAYQHNKSKIIAITGTNGKTTTTLLTYHLLKNAGINVTLAGNVGKSFAKAVLENSPEYFVVEVSSFQLDGIDTFKPDIAILLNITPDHLDRYQGSMEAYAASKLRISKNMDDKCTFIYYEDDPQIKKLLHLVPKDVERKPVSLHNPNAAGFYDENKIIFPGHTDFEISTEELALKGPHNFINSMCAALAAKKAHAKKKKILAGLENFKNYPHRLENVGEIREVTFINDSKATNVQSVKYALESFSENLIWIAGGIDKGNDYSLIRQLVDRKVKILICLGKDNEKLKKAFNDVVDEIFETTIVQEAVQLAIQHADPGDVVLLSPACSSFDLFLNYEDRGNQFKNAVRQLDKNFKSPL